jgi:hypothetical protein
MIQAGYTYEPAWNEEIVIEPRKQRIVKKVVKKKANMNSNGPWPSTIMTCRRETRYSAAKS